VERSGRHEGGEAGRKESDTGRRGRREAIGARAGASRVGDVRRHGARGPCATVGVGLLMARAPAPAPTPTARRRPPVARPG
jgi:hypothetical protein